MQYAFMVGGFSESPYVYETIKAFAEGYGLQVIRPAHALVISHDHSLIMY